MEFEVHVEVLLGIVDATSMIDLLRHQEVEKRWVVSGMKRHEALVKVDGMITHASGLHDQAIAQMEVLIASAASRTFSCGCGSSSSLLYVKC
uniref:Uncharacterized protein n=1 Tax=Setaria viridis TaxID=4556 RepID=A0A4U6W4C3_SETVI|nr:hypothetical protein SEVIR_1G041501v2 [Setaria viridis]